MKRLVIKLKDGTYVNVNADCLDYRKGFIMAWCGDTLVAIVNAKETTSCHISEQKIKEI